MLNRTNRTLSATTNRLNLGTRKLDGNASANIGTLTLHFAHVDLPVVPVVTVRSGVVAYPAFRFEGPPIRTPEAGMPAMPAMSGSSPESSWPKQGAASRDQQGQPVALASQTVGTIVVRSGDDGNAGRCAPTPRLQPDPARPSTILGLGCDPARLAGRSARATLVSAAAP